MEHLAPGFTVAQTCLIVTFGAVSSGQEVSLACSHPHYSIFSVCFLSCRLNEKKKSLKYKHHSSFCVSTAWNFSPSSKGLGIVNQSTALFHKGEKRNEGLLPSQTAQPSSKTTDADQTTSSKLQHPHNLVFPDQNVSVMSIKIFEQTVFEWADTGTLIAIISGKKISRMHERNGKVRV